MTIPKPTYACLHYRDDDTPSWEASANHLTYGGGLNENSKSEIFLFMPLIEESFTLHHSQRRDLGCQLPQNIPPKQYVYLTRKFSYFLPLCHLCCFHLNHPHIKVCTYFWERNICFVELWLRIIISHGSEHHQRSHVWTTILRNTN
jgi:hypothetical protein